ncbi:cyclic-di-AMP receptor [Peptoniphilus mikwangii]|uniref:cyclic-di-AMP receptor n=1 Tax=Peptoniphilus mikwangii TaxID=1354300 RepID=UPI0003FBDF01|nr:cyclic-di-AMP receptor [Peptoniphilus mikwangii]
MKLVIAIVQDVDADHLIEELTKNNFRVTKMSTTGGFLKSGNTTLLIGVDDNEVEALLKLITNNCKTREVTKTIQTINIPGQAMIPVPIQVRVGGATAFVLNVEEFKRY